MADVIKKDTSIAEAQNILSLHGCSLAPGWELVIGMMLQECDYIEVHGFGSKAYFSKILKAESEDKRCTQ